MTNMVGRVVFDGAEEIAFWVYRDATQEEAQAKIYFGDLEDLSEFLAHNFSGRPYKRQRIRNHRNPDKFDLDPFNLEYGEPSTVPCVVCGVGRQRGGTGCCSTECLQDFYEAYPE